METTVHRSEWIAIVLMAALLIAGCVLIPLISSYIVEPYIYSVFGTVGQSIATDNLWIACICVAFVVIVLFAGLGCTRTRKVDVYLSGVGRDHDARTFQNSMSGTSEASARNWYMEDFFGESRVAPVGVVVNIVIMAAALVLALVGLPIVL